jgi:hypothetical protein
MKTINKFLFVLCGIAWLSWPNVADAQGAAAVRVKLSLADDKTVYRSGEPIKLILEFTADGGGYQVDTMPDRSEPTSDAVSVSPDSGVRHWLEEYLGGRGYARDVISLANLSTGPTRVELLLNDSVRFDRAGKYSVKVTTRRVSLASPSPDSRPPIILTTNGVSFEVQPMSAADEEREVKRLSDLLDAAHGAQAEEKLTEELSFLTGDASSREKVRRFLNSEGRSGNYAVHITRGLFIARDRALVLRLLEATMRDPKTPVTSALLGAVSKLRMLRDGVKENSAAGAEGAGAPFSPLGDPRFTAIQDVYVQELAGGLGARAGKSQTTTAMTVLTHLPKEPERAGPMLAAVRPLLLQQFEGLHPFDQEYLLRAYWEQLRDPALIPPLKKMLGATGVASKNIHDAALKRLIEIAPDEARAYVIAEIRDPTSLVDLEVLGGLNDKSLPEVDEALLDRIRRLASSKASFDSVYLKQKTSLAARYATGGIYGDLMQLYRDAAAKLPLESRAALLAYFARYNEQEALSLIQQTLDGLEPGQDFNLLPDLTRLYYSDGLDALLVKCLDTDEPQAASTAAYLLSLHGSAGDEKVLESRLERWRKDWGRRGVEAETNLQGMVERELILALIHGKAWKLAPERVRELEQSCATRLCRQNFHPQ